MLQHDLPLIKYYITHRTPNSIRQIGGWCYSIPEGGSPSRDWFRITRYGWGRGLIIID